jgi:hypothetical protein
LTSERTDGLSVLGSRIFPKLAQIPGISDSIYDKSENFISFCMNSGVKFGSARGMIHRRRRAADSRVFRACPRHEPAGASASAVAGAQEEKAIDKFLPGVVESSLGGCKESSTCRKVYILSSLLLL